MDALNFSPLTASIGGKDWLQLNSLLATYASGVTQGGRSETARPARFDSFNAKKLDGGAVEVLYKKDGKVVGREIHRLTADGQQMTIGYRLLTRTGECRGRVLVLEKQKQ
jgi:hypothetical protein